MFGNILGWLGAILILFAYGCLSFERISQTDWRYHLLNLVGSICLASDCLLDGTYPAAVLNIIFTAVALYALVRFLKRDAYQNTKQ